MRPLFNRSYAVLAFTLVAGCASAPQTPEPSSASLSGTACVGTVINPPTGLSETQDPALLQTAEGAPGQGKLCTGKVYIAEEPVTVYRVWDSAKAYTAYGSWWSFSYPEGSKESYRKAEDICPEWSSLDRMSTCSIKVGTHVVVGPGQSVDCNNNLSYPQS
ncbi:MAG: hypothetical protein ACU83U_14665, partial [Gammaproteobacteria bacterium]